MALVMFGVGYGLTDMADQAGSGGRLEAKLVGTAFGVDYALKHVGDFPELRALVDAKPAGAKVDTEARLDSSSSRPFDAAQPVVSILRGGLPSSAAILLTSSLGRGACPASSLLEAEVDRMLAACKETLSALAGYRARLLDQECPRMIEAGIIRRAVYRDSPQVSTFLRRPDFNSGSLHMDPKLYDGGSCFAAWRVSSGELYMVTYDHVPELFIIDNYSASVRMAMLQDVVVLLASEGAIGTDVAAAALSRSTPR